MKQCRLQATRAFSLLELLVAISITGIIITLAVPSFTSLIKQSTVESKANIIFDIFQLSRRMAISQGKYITICPSANGNQCSNKWQDGLMAFFDKDVDRTRSVSEEIITLQPTTASATLHGNRKYFTYGPLGTLKGGMGSLIVCSGDTGISSRLLVSQMGRVRVEIDAQNPSCKNGFRY